jgi:hypothetical protein
MFIVLYPPRLALRHRAGYLARAPRRERETL